MLLIAAGLVGKGHPQLHPLRFGPPFGQTLHQGHRLRGPALLDEAQGDAELKFLVLGVEFGRAQEVGERARGIVLPFQGEAGAVAGQGFRKGGGRSGFRRRTRVRAGAKYRRATCREGKL